MVAFYRGNQGFSLRDVKEGKSHDGLTQVRKAIGLLEGGAEKINNTSKNYWLGLLVDTLQFWRIMNVENCSCQNCVPVSLRKKVGNLCQY